MSICDVILVYIVYLINSYSYRFRRAPRADWLPVQLESVARLASCHYHDGYGVWYDQDFKNNFKLMRRDSLKKAEPRKIGESGERFEISRKDVKTPFRTVRCPFSRAQTRTSRLKLCTGRDLVNLATEWCVAPRVFSR